MTRLAKLTRPRLHHVLARNRLFAQLDESRAHAVVWVVGPPGSGKTALVASYIESARLPHVWYHLDGGDRDAATFFHYLSQAQAASRRAAPLPLITPEHLADLGAFARYYFREFFLRLKRPAVLVLDNYQDVPAESALHDVLEQAAEETPEGVCLIFISREDPPSQFARLDASDRLARIEWRDLRLTLPEAAAIAALRHQLDAEALRDLYEMSGGWAAGLTLALEQMKRTSPVAHRLEGHALEPVFNYFAGLVLRNTDPATREFLLRTALFPRTTTAMAQAISGDVQAGRHLDHFYRRRLFTDRRGDPPYTYQYHDLFRAFLLEQLRESRPEEEVNALRRQAGAILEGAQRHDDAFVLYRSAADWPAMVRLILAQAQILIGQGRGAALRGWIAQLPEAEIAGSPWLSYWHGMSLLAFAPDEATPHLVRAHGAWAREGDSAGQLACCTAIILAYQSDLNDFAPLSLWADRLLALLNQCAPPPPMVQLLSSAGLLYFFHVCRPQAPEYPAVQQKALELLLSDEIPVNDRIVPACMVLQTVRETGEFALCDRIIAALHPHVTSGQVSPGDQALWFQLLAWTETSRGNRIAAATACRQGEAMCTAHAIKGRARYIYIHMVSAANAFQAGDLANAESHMEQMELHMSGRRSLERGWACWIRSVVAAMRNNWDDAVRYAEEELAILKRSGAVFHLYFAHLHHAAGLIGQARFGPARAAIALAREVVADSNASRNTADVDLMAAWLALNEHDDVAFERYLRAAFALLRSTEFHACLWYVDQRILSSVLAAAMERTVEVESARAMITTLRLLPPRNAGDSWPWPLRIRLLGGLGVVRDGVPMEGARKPARKLLALLKALACAGAEGATEIQLMDWLWPESEGDAGRRALDVSVHRLRALLGGAEFITASHGRIRLEAKHTWVDAWAFEEATRNPDIEERSIRRASDLYEGMVLPEDMDAAWTVSCRERLRDRFNRLIQNHATLLESRSDHLRALEWYTRGLEADDLLESTYQGVMRCQISLRRHADAIATFQRLQRTLALKLRAAPSPQSLALVQSARTDANP